MTQRSSRSIVAVVFFLVCFGAVGLLTATDSTEVTEPIKKSLSEWVAMWNSYDLDGVSHLFVTDDRVTYFSSEKEGLIVGIGAVVEHHRGFGFVPGGKSQDNELGIEDVKITNLGSSVVVTAIWYFRRADGTVQKGPMTGVFVIEESTAKIIHLHFANYPSPKATNQETEIEE